MPQKQSLWTFSCTLYAADGVADCCLFLQDEYDVDVTLLLFSLWYAGQLGEFRPSDLTAACQISQQWRAEVVAPLRRIRRRMKATHGADSSRPANETDSAEAMPLFPPEQKEFSNAREQLRQQVKHCELEAEKLQLQLLEAKAMNTKAQVGVQMRVQMRAQAGPTACETEEDLATIMTRNLQALQQAMHYNQLMESQYAHLVAAALKLWQTGDEQSASH